MVDWFGKKTGEKIFPKKPNKRKEIIV